MLLITSKFKPVVSLFTATGTDMWTAGVAVSVFCQSCGHRATLPSKLRTQQLTDRNACSIFILDLLFQVLLLSLISPSASPVLSV